MRGTKSARVLCAWQVKILTSQLTIYFYFFNPARRPQARKGRLAADALRQRRDGVKEDYYV